MAMMASPWLSVAFAGLQLVQGMRSSAAAQEAADYNYQIETQNAEILRQRRAEEAEEMRYQQKRYLATQKANIGKSGVFMSGSPVAVLGEITSRQYKDFYNFKKTNDYEYYNNRNRANVNLWKGQQQASQLMWGSIGSAGSTLITAGGDLWQQSGR